MTAIVRADVQVIAESAVDPELPMLTLHDLGVLRGVRVEAERVIVELAPTYSGCPAIAEMRADLTARLRAAGYRDVEVRLVLSPPWTSDDISAHGRRLLAEHGIAPPGPAPWPACGPVPLILGGPPPRPACPQCNSRDTELLSRFGTTACKSLHRCRTCSEPFEHLKAI